MGNIKAVLFDLDGTLLPMDQDQFVAAYFGELTKKFAPMGYDPKTFVAGIWQGTKAMVMNNGEKLNEDRFWEAFSAVVGESIIDKNADFDEFYENQFHLVQKSCGYNPKAVKVIERVKEKNLRAILATNPIFPAAATYQRCSWAGLEPSMFEYISTFENSHFCKPNLEYYKEILAKCGLVAEECVMVGNDVSEDMIAEKLGMKVFLLTDCIINKADEDINVLEHGGFFELLEFIDKL
jgi:FMN phosphatase YigB (HAD superfamily)